MTRGHRGSLLPRCRAPSSPSPCRFIRRTQQPQAAPLTEHHAARSGRPAAPCHAPANGRRRAPRPPRRARPRIQPRPHGIFKPLTDLQRDRANEPYGYKKFVLPANRAFLWARTEFWDLTGYSEFLCWALMADLEDFCVSCAGQAGATYCAEPARISASRFTRAFHEGRPTAGERQATARAKRGSAFRTRTVSASAGHDGRVVRVKGRAGNRVRHVRLEVERRVRRLDRVGDAYLLPRR